MQIRDKEASGQALDLKPLATVVSHLSRGHQYDRIKVRSGHTGNRMRSAQKARVWKLPFVDVLPNLLARKAVGEFRFLLWFFTEPWLVCLQGTDGPGRDSVLRR